ncbi:hypothetical protein F383_28669 [Gossypium arboreum]|uniref:Uncharacterized protein n=1 Tax=Gossypium arboreum TaxID=29729 RepID=A0A0B0MYY1_GOSAR|nr:hypothetical protein F383_28669 [Gossypium arboreum]
MAKASFVPSKSVFSSICITLYIHVKYMNTTSLHLDMLFLETVFYDIFYVEFK